jgi:Tfp pilus assembly protein FimT
MEMVGVVAIAMVLATVSLPGLSKTLQSYRGSSDVRMVAAQLTLARMRAAAEFTQARMNASLTGETVQIQLYDKASASFVTEGGTQKLSQNVTFGYGNITAPAGSQTTIAQSPQIIFNSRGIPVDSGGVPTGAYAIYLTNGSGQYYAVTVSVSSAVNIWLYEGSAWVKIS